jgi:hypothetical protein
MELLTKYKYLSVIISLLIFSPRVLARVSNGEMTNAETQFTGKTFGKNAFIFEPSMNMSDIQELIDKLYIEQHHRKGEFSKDRYALLFKPGTYTLDLKVGYYMHYMGLGQSPKDVIIKGTIISRGLNHGNVTLNFWRSVENLTIDTPAESVNIWGVSQAAPLRRVFVKGDIQLHDDGWASGGYIADSKFEGNILAGGQQQWFSRNSEIKSWEGGQWNIMFLGVKQAPESNWPTGPITSIPETPATREKPYLCLGKNGYQVNIPKLMKNSSGVSWTVNRQEEEFIPISDFYVAFPESDNAQTINKAIDQGKNLIFTPGIYQLKESIRIKRPNTIVLGIGMATLVAQSGNSVIDIDDVDGISVCGLTVDAGEKTSDALFVVGENKTSKSHQENPIFLFDIFIRIGGYGLGKADASMVINSNDVVIDHTWLWRADHGEGVSWEENTCKNGLIVNGDRVTAYGLFCEHFQEYQTLWNGDQGKVFFYQSEMPYDPPAVESWKHGSTYGYASYKVSDQVKSHEAWGLGIYNVFYDAPVIVDQAIETPIALEKDIHHKIIFWLNGNKESVVKSIINGKGGQIDFNNRKAIMK